MKILGIETSCDETAAAVVEDGVKILSNVIVSQIDIFAEYGGVIPEVAARSHLEVIMPVIEKALSDASCGWDDIDAIAVTHAPGLLGSLLIGTLAARTLAILHDKPLYAVHHLKSHVYANWLSEWQLEHDSSRGGSLAPVATELASSSSVVISGNPRKVCPQLPFPKFPLLALVVSGGHTQILYMRGHNQFEIVGTTRDDAVGECFDKVAKILGLPYPGGPSIAKAAKNCLPNNPTKYKFPHPKVEGLNFSFSGLKTAVLRAVQKEAGVPISYPSHKLAELLTPKQVADFATSFQKTAIEILLEKMKSALAQYPETKSMVVAGGVSANEKLRVRFKQLEHSFSRGESLAPVATELASSSSVVISGSPRKVCPQLLGDVKVFFPAPALSGDNGAMVATAAYYEIQSGVEPTDPYKLNIYPRVAIDS